MKSSYSVCILFIGAITGVAHAGQATGRSFFQPRVPSADQLLQFADHADYEVAQTGVRGFGFNATAGYQASTNDSRFASYFLPNGKNNLTVKGANAPGDRDISAMWLQIAGENTILPPRLAPLFTAGAGAAGAAVQWLNEYESTIHLAPQFTSAYATTQLSYGFSFCSVPWQAMIELPVLQVRNTVAVRETAVQHALSSRDQVNDLIVYNAGDPELVAVVRPEYALSAVEALQNPTKLYGKISGRARELRGIGDVRCELRAQPVPSVVIGLCGALPTAPKGTAEYLFEPLLGSNGHGTLGLYATLNETLWQWERLIINLRAHMQYQVQLAGSEMRTFDLVQAGPWSRYLLLVDATNNPLSAVSGVNFLTRPVHVAARNQATAGIGLQASYKQVSLAVGYTANAREKERLALQGQLPAHVFIAGQFAPNARVSRRTIYAAPKNISINQHIAVFQDAFGEPATSPELALNNSDLDLQSAAMPQYFSHELNASLGFASTLNGQEVQLRVGGSYEWLQTGRSFDVFSVFGGLSVKI